VGVSVGVKDTLLDVGVGVGVKDTLLDVGVGVGVFYSTRGGGKFVQKTEI